jgi:hypothetical protein
MHISTDLAKFIALITASAIRFQNDANFAMQRMLRNRFQIVHSRRHKMFNTHIGQGKSRSMSQVWHARSDLPKLLLQATGPSLALPDTIRTQ